MAINGISCPIEMIIQYNEGQPVKNAVIHIGHNMIAHTDTTGKAKIAHVDEGTHAIKIYVNQKIVFHTQLVITCKEPTVRLIIEDFHNSRQIQEVKIAAQTINDKLEKSPFSVQVIDMKGEYNKSGDVSTILNRMSGVRLRSDGNLGSAVQVNLGGLQGKAIKIFRDGIPIDLFGHGFNLGTLSTNMLEHIEIYKGVMPVYLASDALGGGINLVTRSPKNNFGELSYEYSSFNTHRSTANLFFVPKRDSSIYYGFNGSFNYSDNNYKVNAPFIDSETSQVTYKNVKRFHDATSVLYNELYAGIRNKKWADDIRMTIIYSNFYKEVQHDEQMNNAYGEPFSKEHGYTGLISYRKVLLNDRLKTNFTGVYSYYDTQFIDTAKVRYDWNGSISSHQMFAGEINKGSNQQVNFNMLSARINAEYLLSDNHFLEYSDLFYHQKRQGSDPLGAVTHPEEVDVLTIPALYKKNSRALAFRSYWMGKSLESIFALKHYYFHSNGYTTDNYNFAWSSSSSDHHLGYLSGLKWIKNKFLFKFSYEYATRLPDEFEIFGDSRMTKENLDLEPEKGHNFNLNLQYFHSKANNDISIATTLFYRKVKDIIFLQPDIPFNRHINYEQARIAGLEVETKYSYQRLFDVSINATYQDIRRIDITESIFKNLENSRVPNIPFLFGNTMMNLHIPHIISKHDQISFRLVGSYTHRFFLKPVTKEQEPPLFGKITNFQTSLVIPGDNRLGQFYTDAGIYYQFPNRKLSLSAECLNFMNTKLYDNFNIQKQGRTLHFKILYRFI